MCAFLSVFDDGDEKTLRRTSLCLKGERHFAESEVSPPRMGSLCQGLDNPKTPECI